MESDGVPEVSMDPKEDLLIDSSRINPIDDVLRFPDRGISSA